MKWIIMFFMLGLPAFYGIRLMRKEKHRKKKQLDLAMAYDRLVLRNKLSIEHSEVLGDSILALDRRNNKLLLVDHSETGKQEVCIPLTAIAAAKISKERNDKGHIKKIWLQVKNSNGNIHRICFFDEATDPVFGLLRFSRRAVHWADRINPGKDQGKVALEQELVF